MFHVLGGTRMIMSPATADDQYWACVRFYRIRSHFPVWCRNFDLTKNNSAKMPNFQILIYKLKNPLKHLGFSSSLLLVYYYIRYLCIIAMHWLYRPSRRAKVEQRVSSWSGGQTCYQVALGIALKLVPVERL